jgi:hypothetical protein
MEIVAWLYGLAIGAAAAWLLMQWRTAVAMSRLRSQLEERIGYWREETERARASAVRLSEQAAAWSAGCQQGREDVLSLTQALASRYGASQSRAMCPASSSSKGPGRERQRARSGSMSASA